MVGATPAHPLPLSEKIISLSSNQETEEKPSENPPSFREEKERKIGKRVPSENEVEFSLLNRSCPLSIRWRALVFTKVLGSEWPLSTFHLYT